MDARDILGAKLFDTLDSLFDLMEYSEDEIAKAMRRHRKHADRIWHSFKLLRPANETLHNELLYRAHCREILDRVARGEDTRPGTAAECIAVLKEASLNAPFTTAAAGLYFRMWSLAGMPDLGGRANEREHYEALKRDEINDMESELRRKLFDGERALPAVIEHARYCPVGLSADTDAKAA